MVAHAIAVVIMGGMIMGILIVLHLGHLLLEIFAVLADSRRTCTIRRGRVVIGGLVALLGGMFVIGIAG